MTLIIHSLKHVADDVINMQCPIEEISAFPMENKIGKIKKLVTSSKNPIAQISRREFEQSSIQNVARKRRYIEIKKKIQKFSLMD